MSRIPTPARDESQPLLQAVKKQLGIAPNLFRIVATSPVALLRRVRLMEYAG